MNELAHDNASYEEIKDRKTVQKDDYLNVDYTTTINGKENSDYSDSNLDMHLGDGNLNVDENVDVDEKLIGAKVGDTVTLEIDKEKRALSGRNHSATHLLQRALRNVLGNHGIYFPRRL